MYMKILLILFIDILLISHVYAEDIVYVCISQSMPNATIENYINEKTTNKIVFIFRGFDKSLIKYLVPLLKDKKVSMMIDPFFFKTYSVDKVPCFITIKENQIAKMYGAVSIFGFIEFVSNYGYKSHGIRGKTWMISEPILDDQLKKQIDFKSISKGISDNLDNKLDCFEFSLCSDNIGYEVNNLFKLKNDIVINGKLLEKKGKTNKIDINNFELIIFNKPGQVDKIKSYLKANQNKYIILMFACGKQLTMIQSQFKRKVYVLNDYIINRLQISCLPVLVKHQNNKFYISKL